MWSFQIQVRYSHPFEIVLTRADSASSAVRNLNDYEIMNRKLRVDFSNDGGEDDSNTVCLLALDVIKLIV